jgi:hypothetical protein
LEVEDADDLKNISIDLLKVPKKELDFKENKWTFYFLKQEEINLIEKIKQSNIIPQLKSLAKVEV